jgi:hypothetical protein
MKMQKAGRKKYELQNLLAILLLTSYFLPHNRTTSTLSIQGLPFSFSQSSGASQRIRTVAEMHYLFFFIEFP